MRTTKLISTIALSMSLFGATATKAQDNTAKTFSIPVIGNGFEVGHSGGPSSIRRNAAVLNTHTSNPTAVYFKVLGKGKIGLQLKGSVQEKTKVQYEFLGEKKIIELSPNEPIVNLGSYNINEPGYFHVGLLVLQGELNLSDIIVSGDATQEGLIYSNDPNYYYWARRGPSCHLGYQVPSAKDVTYYYNEVIVPEGNDVKGSYYMANGFAEGYFGMQVNSATERRILFSVWSPFHTDDPKSIPDDQKIHILKKGGNVQTGEFGNEGSGGQSFLRYNWKAGVSYKFLLKGQPDGHGNTDYTAWFFAAEENNWLLIASFKRPKTNTYLKGFHSFLENFDPNQGYLTRQALYNNQWVFDGEWKKATAARLTVDATYRANQRVDATGGTTNTGYFLKMGGFFNEIEKPNTIFSFENKSQAPQIDFSKLP